MAEEQDTPVGSLRLAVTGWCGDRKVHKGWAIVDDDEIGRRACELWWNFNTGTNYPVNKLGPRGTPLKMLHRFVYELHHGPIPKGKEIDHVNRDIYDSRISNLRMTDRRGNTLNRKMQSNNTSGHVGVTWDKQRGKWAAQVKRGGKNRHLGVFDNIEEAAVVARKARLELFADYAEFLPAHIQEIV